MSDSTDEITARNATFALESLENGAVEIKRWHEIKVNVKGQSELSEVLRRYDRLLVDFKLLVSLNKKLREGDRSSVSLDSESGVMSFSVWGHHLSIKLKSEDPNVPLQILSSSAVSAYEAAHADKIPGNKEARFDLETRIESFYQNAHRIQRILQELFNLKKKDCRAITMVRNHLIEHKTENIGYSFGIGSTGPKVQPMRPSNMDIYNDEGLFKNAVDFGKYVSSVIKQSS